MFGVNYQEILIWKWTNSLNIKLTSAYRAFIFSLEDSFDFLPPCACVM